MLTMHKEALPAAPTPRPGTGQRRQPWPGLEQEKPPPGVFSTGSGGGGQERQQAGDGFAEGRHSAPMGCKLPPPQSPGRGDEARPGLPAQPQQHPGGRPGRQLTSPRAAPACPCRAPLQQAAAPQQRPSAQLCPGRERKHPGCPAAPLSQRLPRAGPFPSLPQPPRGTRSAPGARPAPAPRHPSCAPAEAVASRAYPGFGSSPHLLQPTANSPAAAEETTSCSS